MNVFLWVLQVFLAFTFGYSGVMKSSQSREELVSMGQTGVDGLPYSTIRFIGITEILGVVGIIAPWATGVVPILTPITAVCFAIIMILASQIHYKRKESKAITLNVILFCISFFVAWMRFSQL